LVDDQAVAGTTIASTQELGGAVISAHGETVELECEFQRIANGRIVVNDGHHGGRTVDWAGGVIALP
jgi:hypothetical protein